MCMQRRRLHTDDAGDGCPDAEADAAHEHNSKDDPVDGHDHSPVVLAQAPVQTSCEWLEDAVHELPFPDFQISVASTGHKVPLTSCMFGLQLSGPAEMHHRTANAQQRSQRPCTQCMQGGKHKVGAHVQGALGQVSRLLENM